MPTVTYAPGMQLRGEFSGRLIVLVEPERRDGRDGWRIESESKPDWIPLDQLAYFHSTEGWL